MEGYDDIDDENEWRAIDSDDDNDDGANDNDNDKDFNDNNDVERDDDVDIGFRSHQFQYGSAQSGKRKRTRRQNQEEAIYGVFYESDDNNKSKGGRWQQQRSRNNTTTMGAPVFVAASKSHKKDPDPSSSFVLDTPVFVTSTSSKTEGGTTDAPMFVSAGTDTTAAATTATTTATSKQPKTAEANDTKDAAAKTGNEHETAADVAAAEKEENERIQKEQKAADEHFLGLLEKAKTRNKRSRPERPKYFIAASEPAIETTQPNVSMGRGGLGLGADPPSLGLPSSFGGMGMSPTGGGGLGFGRYGDEKNHAKKDPSLGTWERHTKGFGSKLLAKMGWTGSGGLGSNRRTFRGESPTTNEKTKEDVTQSGNEPETKTTTAPAPVPAPPKAAVKKGISRPVEVVVRPSNMGLGFGNFKEASQLKGNRRIEAEVRGIDYDTQVRKEKEEEQKKRRQRRGQRYGEDYDDVMDDDDDDDGPTRNINSSAIASTEDLLLNQSWKARRSRNNKMKKKTKNVPEIISYTELIERQKRKYGGASSSQPVIIDMRGPDYVKKTSKSTSTGGTVVVALGEELLYNLSFLLNTYENKLHSSARYHETSLLPKVESTEREIHNLEEKSLQAQTRIDKLKKAYEITDRVKETMAKTTSTIATKTKNIESARLEAKKLVAELENVFTPEECKDLQFWNVLAPTLLGPIVQTTLENWNPFFGTPDEKAQSNNDRLIVDSFFEFKSSGNRNNDNNSNSNNYNNKCKNDSRVLCESIIRNQLIPKLKADIEAESSPRWDPIKNPYAVLDLYEYLRTKAVAFDETANTRNKSNNSRNHDANEDEDPNQIFPSGNDCENEETGGSSNSMSDLVEYIRKELIINAVYPKLQSSILRWKPSFSHSSEKTTLEDPLNLWVLPWLPHIDHPALLPNFVTDCKRKIKGALSFIRRKLSTPKDDRDYVIAVADLLRPWQVILGAKSLPQMISKDSSVVARLAQLLSSWNSTASSSTNGKLSPPNWDDLRLLFELHSRRMISDVDFLSTIEGPILTHWARSVHVLLCDGLSSIESCAETATASKEELNSNSTSLETAVGMYREWKMRILVDPCSSDVSSSLSSSVKNDNDSRYFSCGRSLLLLKGDRYICRIFYSVLCMIQVYQSSSLTISARLEELDQLEPQVHGFRMISARRFLEEKQALQEDFVRMESRSEGETRARIVLKRRNVTEPTFREVVEEFANDRGVLFRPRIGANSLSRDGKQIYLFGGLPIYLEGDVVFYNNNSTWRPLSLDQLMGVVASNK